MNTWENIKYVKHCVFHPFDGFYEAKNRGRGSLLDGCVFSAVAKHINANKTEGTVGTHCFA